MFRYWMPNDGETVDDAEDVYDERYARKPDGSYGIVKVFDFHDHESAAEAAAQLHYDRSSEWHEGDVRISVIDEAGEVLIFDVSVEYSPQFSASKVDE